MEKTDETVSLISAGKVQGTNVYNTGRDSRGEVYDVMIDKRSRRSPTPSCHSAALGVGEHYHPCRGTPESDARQGGYGGLDP